MKKTSISMSAAIISLMLSACTSTEVIDNPFTPTEESRTITLTLSNPNEGNTRAGENHDGHKLRYSAKLLKGILKSTTAGVDPEFVERKEILATDNEGTITFSVPEGEYTIILFADYIPEDQQPDDKGLYQDCYYNTAYTESGRPSHQVFTVNKFEINNDNLDCFGSFITLTKTSQKIEKDLTLSRLVGKVRFVSTTDLRDGMVLDNIEISTLPYFTKYTIHNPDDKIIITATEKPTSPYRTSLTPPIGTKQEDGDTELFFYYTFANKDKPYTAMDAASFKINYTDGTSRETSIQTGIIQAVRNNITTMKGAILMPETTEKGPIILHLSSQDDWGSDNKSIKF